MRILEILLPQGTSDRSLSPQVARKIDALQQRMDRYVDKILDPKTSPQGKEFLKLRLRDDYYELKDVMPKVHHVAEAIRKLEELFKNPPAWEWILLNNEEATAAFTVEGKKYIFNAHLEDVQKKLWIVIFKAVIHHDDFNAEYGITGTGNSTAVFSAVTNILSDFAKRFEKSIDILVIEAKEPSRKKLYLRILNRLFPNWTITEDHRAITVTKPKSKVTEAIRKLPLSDDDFKFVKELMLRPIPAAVAPIYILEFIDDDEFNDQLLELENSNPALDVRPLVVEWFKRVMPDQMHRFTGDSRTPDMEIGLLSPIHGYDPRMYHGANDPITGNAFGRR